MKRIIFKLSMPNVGSWNGKWTGSGNKYFRVFKMADKAVRKLIGDKERMSWFYNFGDGWSASVEASIVPAGEKFPKSDGFCGYDWMIDSILSRGEIRPPKRN
jgi:hypothetical protein